jgi:hypothetical protein
VIKSIFRLSGRQYHLTLVEVAPTAPLSDGSQWHDKHAEVPFIAAERLVIMTWIPQIAVFLSSTNRACYELSTFPEVFASVTS